MQTILYKALLSPMGLIPYDGEGLFCRVLFGALKIYDLSPLRRFVAHPLSPLLYSLLERCYFTRIIFRYIRYISLKHNRSYKRISPRN